MNLIDQARLIINQRSHNPADLIELSKIKREMSCLFESISRLTAEEETEYNQTRCKQFISYKSKTQKNGKNISDAQAELLAKNDAEKSFGGYRVHKAESLGLREQMQALEGFIISIYHKNKNEATVV